MKYQEWIDTVDSMCWDELGLSIHDLPDVMTRDGFDDELTPAEFFEMSVLTEREQTGYYDFFA